MPGMDGFGVIEQVRHEGWGDNMVIMMPRSSGQQQALARCRSLGVALYLTKPVRQNMLLHSITDALSNCTLPAPVNWKTCADCGLYSASNEG